MGLVPRFQKCGFCYPERERIVFETRSFYALLSLGPITEGHTLLNSKMHYPCCAAIEELDEWLIAKRRLVSLLRMQYGPCILFEHGRTATCVDEENVGDHESTLCFHAHLHVVPAAVDLLDDLQAYRRVRPCKSWGEVVDFYRENEEYLFYEDKLGRMTVLRAGRLPQYFLRWLVASKLGFPERASWRQYRGDEVVRSALGKLRERVTGRRRVVFPTRLLPLRAVPAETVRRKAHS